MVAAGKEMPEFVREQDSHQSEGEWKPGGKARWIFVKESKRPQQFVDGHRLIVSIGGGELCASDEAGAERQQEQEDRENQRSPGGPVRNRCVIPFTQRRGAPVDIDRDG